MTSSAPLDKGAAGGGYRVTFSALLDRRAVGEVLVCHSLLLSTAGAVGEVIV